MIVFNEFSRIYLYRGVTDMRRQINGLAAMVQNEMKLSPFERYLFVFSGRRRNVVKMLYWDLSGFCLWLKRLEKEKFIWPKIKDCESVEISEKQLRLLLEGYDIWRMKPHEKLNYKHVS